MRGIARLTLICYLSVALVLLGGLSSGGWAMIAPSADLSVDQSQKIQDLTIVQRHLESKVVTEQLQQLGLSPEQVNERISALSPDQLHEVATNLEGLQAGGIDPTTTTILIIVGVVIVGVVLLALLLGALGGGHHDDGHGHSGGGGGGGTTVVVPK